MMYTEDAHGYLGGEDSGPGIISYIGPSWTRESPLCWTRHHRGHDVGYFNDDRRGLGNGKRSWKLIAVKGLECSLDCVREKTEKSTKTAYW